MRCRGTRTSLEPSPGAGQVVVDVGAAAIHHLDLFKASGNFYLEQPLPSVIGTDGVGVTGGRRVYFDAVAPHGSMAERARRRGGGAVRRPRRARRPERRGARQHRARRLARALLARGPRSRGRRCSVLGATGQVGTVAVQAAKLLRRRPRDRGRARAATASTGCASAAPTRSSTLDGDDLTERIREAAGGDVDVTIDSLWGEPAVAAMGAAARFGRHVQVGQLAGPEPRPLRARDPLEVARRARLHGPAPGARDPRRRLQAARRARRRRRHRHRLRAHPARRRRERLGAPAQRARAPKLVLIPKGDT